MKFPKTIRHFFPEKVKSGDWFQYDPYMGAFTGERHYIKDDNVRWDMCLSKTLKVGDTIPTGMVLEEEIIMNIVYEARKWAHEAHDSINQKRKYSNKPYWVHTDEVEELLRQAGESEDVQAAGDLHDVEEDVAPKNNKFSRSEMLKKFGPKITNLVIEVSNVFTKENYPNLNRSERKHKEHERLSSISKEGKSIKLADIISNCKGISSQDASFGKVFLYEKLKLLPSLKDGNSNLYKKAIEVVQKEISNLKLV